MKYSFLSSLSICLALVLSSCSDNDDTEIQNSDFFNLKANNQWVYKKYNFNYSNPSAISFSGIVDSVKVVGIEIYQGFNVAKVSSFQTNTNNGSKSAPIFKYLRINRSGHLVDVSGFIDLQQALSENDGTVLHPGLDSSHIYSTDISASSAVFGTILFQSYQTVNLNVEGNNYLVYPYKGVFTPSPDFNDLVSKTTEDNYAAGIGLVKQVCHGVENDNSWEYRLVSFTESQP